jgi:transcriptional regulator with XRE-family HTH domain
MYRILCTYFINKSFKNLYKKEFLDRGINMMTFGKKLKEIRANHNLTQAQLGEILGVTRATIAGYETKGKEPVYDKLHILAKHFNISYDYIFDAEKGPVETILKPENFKVIHCYDLSEEEIAKVNGFIEYLRFRRIINK